MFYSAQMLRFWFEGIFLRSLWTFYRIIGILLTLVLLGPRFQYQIQHVTQEGQIP